MRGVKPARNCFHFFRRRLRVMSRVMKTKVVVMPTPNKRCVRIRIGSRVYEVRVNVEIAPVSLPARPPLIAMPNQLFRVVNRFE
jgi:hypothetical protein